MCKIKVYKVQWNISENITWIDWNNVKNAREMLLELTGIMMFVNKMLWQIFDELWEVFEKALKIFKVLDVRPRQFLKFLII